MSHSARYATATLVCCLVLGCGASGGGSAGGQAPPEDPPAGGSGGSAGAPAANTGGSGAEATPPPASYDPTDLIRAVGPELHNGRGEVVRLYGPNLGGWLLRESWMTPFEGVEDEYHLRRALAERFGEDGAAELLSVYRGAWLTDQDFANIAADGMNSVRLPIYWETLMTESFEMRRNAAGELDFSIIDWAVDTAAQHGIYTVLDLHGVPGSQNGWDSSGLAGSATFFDDPSAVSAVVTLWQEIARHYAEHPAVAGYDLLNEPDAISGEPLHQFYDQVYDAIRTVDQNHVVIMEGPWNWWDLPHPGDYGWENVMYQIHSYEWNEDAHNDLNQMVGFVDLAVGRSNDYRALYGVPTYLGEFTLFGLQEAWAYGLPAYAQNDLHWSMWSYKVMGHGSGWGLYTPRADVDVDSLKARIWDDSYETIADKWSQWTTSNLMERNHWLADIVRDSALTHGEPVRPRVQ